MSTSIAASSAAQYSYSAAAYFPAPFHLQIADPAAAQSYAASSAAQYSYSAAPYFPAPFHLQIADPAAAQSYAASYVVPAPAPVLAALPVKTPALAPVYPVAAAGVYSVPQYQQAQQLFQKDAHTITPEAIQSVKAALASSESEHKGEIKKKAIPRKAAGQTWEDPTLVEWPESKYVGNRPIKLRKSTWKERTDYEALQRLKNQNPKKPKLPKRSVLHK